jgi:hypothetical protein
MDPKPEKTTGQNIPLKSEKAAPETGGPKGLEPTRYGDWEIGGKCVDF